MKEDQEHDRLTQELLTGIETLWPTEYRRVCDKVMGNGDIDVTFVGFIDIYEALAKIIPKHHVIFDVGCAYAFQAYYFRNHIKYVGIDVPPASDEDRRAHPCLECRDVDARLQTPNSFYYPRHIHQAKDLLEIKERETGDNPTFAICSYVPGRVGDIVREVFHNCFIYYPTMSKEERETFRALTGYKKR